MHIHLSMLSDKPEFINRDVLYTAMTRFNVPMPMVPGAAAIRSRGEIDAWTLKRIDVFRKYCLPSMLNQRVKPHAWIILLNKDLTPPVAALFEELVEHDWIIPLLYGEDWPRRIAADSQDVFRKRFGDKAFNYVSCTRLDSDDSLHAEFHAAIDLVIAKRRRQWTQDTATCIDFPYGAVCYRDSASVLLKEKHVFALVDPFARFRAPYFCGHTQIDAHVPLVSVLTDRPMFIYRRHDANISGPSRVPRWDRFADPALILSYFGLEPARATVLPKTCTAPFFSRSGMVTDAIGHLRDRVRNQVQRLPLPGFGERHDRSGDLTSASMSTDSSDNDGN